MGGGEVRRLREDGGGDGETVAVAAAACESIACDLTSADFTALVSAASLCSELCALAAVTGSAALVRFPTLSCVALSVLVAAVDSDGDSLLRGCGVLLGWCFSAASSRSLSPSLGRGAR